MTTVGFCLITNVPGHNEKKLMKAIQKFHSLPLDVKMKMAPKHWNPKSKHIYQGYFPFCKGYVSNKEFYSMPRPFEDISEWEREGCKMYEPIPWIENMKLKKEYEEVKNIFEDHFKIMHN